MVLHDGKKLAYHKWQEKLTEPAEIVEGKVLETRWLKIKRIPNRKYPWRR